MDAYGLDRKLSELGEFNDLMDSEMFGPSTNTVGLDNYGVDQDWLDSFFEDPVLNDKMMTDAMPPPQIKSEHSYSLSNNEDGPDTPLDMTIGKMDSYPTDMETETYTMSSPATTTCTTTQSLGQATSLIDTIKAEQELITAAATASPAQTVYTVKQPTIILATQQNSNGNNNGNNTTQLIRQERLVLPKVNIKVEPTESSYDFATDSSYETLTLPPTPPGSSSSSDSEGSQSPQRSEPSSPIRQPMSTRPIRHVVHTTSSQLSPSTPLFTSPIPQSGILLLSEEEKRTLISEGYPVPSKLPLTKQEEKNLKKIRRKIKNKISAQESRRKKKEYLETLEKKCEAYTQENCDLKRKCDNLETNNRSLLSQLQKLQALVGKVSRSSGAAAATPTGSCLMVLVLCFAIFLGGSWSPSSLNIGYSSSAPMPSYTYLSPLKHTGPMGPELKDVRVDADAYSTPNKRSRVLLSMREDLEESDVYGPHTPFSYKDMFLSFFHRHVGAENEAHAAETERSKAGGDTVEIPSTADIAAAAFYEDQVNETNGVVHVPPTMHPDIAANVTANIMAMENRTTKA